MAYEYEIEISSLIIDNPSEIDGYAHDELKEVYRKAKAFDEIREIEIQSDITCYYDDTESYMYNVESVIEKYEKELKGEK